jgi:hypothetical protein
MGPRLLAATARDCREATLDPPGLPEQDLEDVVLFESKVSRER